MVDDKKTSNSSWPVRIIEKTNKSIIFNVLKAIIPKFLRTKIKLFLNIIEYKLNKIICFIILKTELRSKLKDKLDIFLDTKQQILFKETVDEPLLSIIITAFNSAELTLECFRCLLNAMLDIKCECIVVDNASTDSTKELLKQFVGIKVIQNTTNEGFIKAVNKAAKVAKGKHLLLLNNNVFVEPSSILALVKKMESLNNIGVVGSKIVLLDGSLQEAGCVVWDNGSTRAYGRGCKPNDEEFSFVRDVDFCSGASLLIRKALFDKLNGFDENFSPAYYEETDFCVRSWQEGYRVVYEPRSVVHNFKCGSNNKVNAFALMKRNHKYFYNKHKQILALYLPSSKNNVILARNHFHNKKRILIIDDRIPFTWLGAGYPRMSKIIEELLECDVQLTFFAMQKNSENITELYKYFADSCEFIWSKGKDGLLDMLRNRNNYFDIIIISREHNKQFFDNIYSEIYKYIANCKIIYDAEAIVAIRTALRSVLSGDSLPQHEIDDMLKKEVKLADNADKVVVVNKHEMKIFKQYSAKPIFELGHCLNITPTKNNFSERKDFIFVGRLEEDGSPNVERVPSIKGPANIVLLCKK